jgi:hypothetical protein
MAPSVLCELTHTKGAPGRTQTRDRQIGSMTAACRAMWLCSAWPPPSPLPSLSRLGAIADRNPEASGQRHARSVVSARYLHPDMAALTEACRTFSAWWPMAGERRPWSQCGLVGGAKGTRTPDLTRCEGCAGCEDRRASLRFLCMPCIISLIMSSAEHIKGAHTLDPQIGRCVIGRLCVLDRNPGNDPPLSAPIRRSTVGAPAGRLTAPRVPPKNGVPLAKVATSTAKSPALPATSKPWPS